MIALDIIACIVALIAFLAFVIPVTFTYEVETIVNKPKSEVFNYLKHLKNQKKFLIGLILVQLCTIEIVN